MFRLYMCDDDKKWLDNAAERIHTFFNAKGVEIEIEKFNNSENLLNTIIEKKQPPEILILDIDMPGNNGFEVAQKVKDIYPDIILIFYTMHEKYVFESFKLQPFRYVCKETTATQLENALGAALNLLGERKDRIISFKTEDGFCNVYVSTIMYFEVEKRRCNIHLKDGRILNVRKTIKQLLVEIDNLDFVTVHSGAVVNVRYIDSYSNVDATIENGDKIDVSRRNFKCLKSAINDYLRRNY